MTLKIKTPWWRMMALAGFVLAADWFSKRWVLQSFSLGESRPLTPFFAFTYVHNTGSAFGLFQNSNNALLALAFIVLGGLLYAARGLQEQAGGWAEAGVALVLGGAVGNILDRIRFGHVVDFLDFHVWPVFNVADSAISAGAVCLALGLLMHRE